MTSISNLICSYCSKIYDETEVHTLCSCGKVLFVKYDIEQAKETLTRNLIGRRNDLWRMHEIMPCSENFRFTLGEGNTPIISLEDVNGFTVYLKNEGLNPTGTFKSRGLCAAVSRGIELGISNFVIPTAGNAGAALSAYTARTKTTAHVIMPKDAPSVIQSEVVAFGGELTLIDGLISDAAKIAKRKGDEFDWFDVSTLKEPYRLEGKKTMGFEIAEQLNWEIPDVIIYPTGGGTGIIGIDKAFDELEELGMINNKRPRMVSVQSSSCAPIVKAYAEGKQDAVLWENAETIAAGLRVHSTIGDYLILDVIRKSGGKALSVRDEEIIYAMKSLARKHGIALSPEAAATYAATGKLQNDGWLDKDDKVLLIATGSGLTTPELWI